MIDNHTLGILIEAETNRMEGADMNIDSNNIVSITEASQNFFKVAQLADKMGAVIISEDGRPKYCLIDLEQNPDLELTEEEAIDIVAARILKRYRPAFEELAK